MKKNVYIAALSLLVFLSPQASEAQLLKGFGKKLEKKVEQQINNRVERQADRAINRSMDKVEGAAEDAVRGSGRNQSEATSSSAANTASPQPSTENSTVTLYDTYEFTLGVTYQIQSGGNKPMETAMWFGGEDYIGMSVPMQPDVFMVMQGGNMITFMQKEKKYMVLGSGMTAGILGAAVAEAEDTEAEEFSITKIGTERLLGFQCSVYELSTAEYNTKLWLTEDLDVDAGHFMSAFATLAKSGGKLPDLNGKAGGVLLKMEGHSIDNKDAMTMEATAVDQNGRAFSTSGYSNFGF